MKDDEESVGGVSVIQVDLTTPRPFTSFKVTWIQYFWGKAPPLFQRGR